MSREQRVAVIWFVVILVWATINYIGMSKGLLSPRATRIFDFAIPIGNFSVMIWWLAKTEQRRIAAEKQARGN